LHKIYSFRDVTLSLGKYFLDPSPKIVRKAILLDAEEETSKPWQILTLRTQSNVLEDSSTGV
jgi:hypothetical protein